MADLQWAEMRAKDLIDEHVPGTEFGWMGKKTAHGHTEFHRVRGAATVKTVIKLSLPATKEFSAREVEDTIRHEIAHVLAGIDAGHGWKWRAIARDLGVDVDATDEKSLRQALAPWVGHCPAGHESPFRFFRKPKRAYACSQCAPVWKPENVITYTKIEVSQ